MGKGICHVELGSADFTGDCRQSRATLCPLAMYEGNDHALPLRENLSMAMNTFNTLIADGSIPSDDGMGIPCEPLIVGDMQGVKCMMGMGRVRCVRVGVVLNCRWRVWYLLVLWCGCCARVCV